MMNRIVLAVAAIALGAGPAAANPGDYRQVYRDKRVAMIADCDHKLDDAKGRREFLERAAQCDRELAKLAEERRQEALKDRREAEKRWRENDRDHGGHGYWQQD